MQGPLACGGTSVLDTTGFYGDNVVVELPPLTQLVFIRTVPSLKSIDSALYYLLVHIPGSFFGVLEFLIGATVASPCTSVLEHDDHFTHPGPFGCDQKQFYMFIAYLVCHVYCIHCAYHCREGYQ